MDLCRWFGWCGRKLKIKRKWEGRLYSAESTEANIRLGKRKQEAHKRVRKIK